MSVKVHRLLRSDFLHTLLMMRRPMPNTKQTQINRIYLHSVILNIRSEMRWLGARALQSFVVIKTERFTMIRWVLYATAVSIQCFKREQLRDTKREVCVRAFAAVMCATVGPWLLLPLCIGGRSVRLSPLVQAAWFLWISEHARRARVELDEQLGELVLRKQGLQEALQKDAGQPAVQRLVLEHVKDAQDALACGFRPDDVLQLIWWESKFQVMLHLFV